MKDHKTLEEIIEFAVMREDTAYRLYKSAAEKTSSIAARKMFEELAAEEAGHKDVFSRIDRAKSEQYRFKDIPDMKIAEYMTDIPFRPDMTYQEILMFAMKAEEQAYQLYRATAEATDDPQLKKTLMVFADVEKGHKLRIESIYDEQVLREM